MGWSFFTSNGAVKVVTTSLSYGTSLPASPIDGQEHVLVDSLTAPTYQWRFRYNAGSASAYKWEFVGGTGLESYVAPLESTSSATYVALTTAGPAITLPRAGDYEITWGCDCIEDGSSYGSMSFDIGGTAASDNDAIWQGTSASTGTESTGMRTLRKTGLTAVTLTAKYRTSAGGAQVRFRSRVLRAVPVRVS